MRLSYPAAFIGLLGLILLGLGVVYLSVECQALPAFMGPVHGDTTPRTGLGVVASALGLTGLAGAVIAARRA